MKFSESQQNPYQGARAAPAAPPQTPWTVPFFISSLYSNPSWAPTPLLWLLPLKQMCLPTDFQGGKGRGRRGRLLRMWDQGCKGNEALQPLSAARRAPDPRGPSGTRGFLYKGGQATAFHGQKSLLSSPTGSGGASPPAPGPVGLTWATPLRRVGREPCGGALGPRGGDAGGGDREAAALAAERPVGGRSPVAHLSLGPGASGSPHLGGDRGGRRPVNNQCAPAPRSASQPNRANSAALSPPVWG